jgi:hypothetical protein
VADPSRAMVRPCMTDHPATANLEQELNLEAWNS